MCVFGRQNQMVCHWVNVKSYFIATELFRVIKCDVYSILI